MTRRQFVQTVSAASTSLYLPIAGAATGDLEKDFAAPPDSARMWTWWFWLADHVDRESITADLEELKAQGMGGVTVYSLSGPGVEPGMRGPDYMSPAWRDLFKHTVSEASRLGLGVSTMMCSGWDAGGPWVKPEQACKQYTHSQLALSGPQAFSGTLPQPQSDKRLYRDVAVFAFRTPAGTLSTDASEQSWRSARLEVRPRVVSQFAPRRRHADPRHLRRAAPAAAARYARRHRPGRHRRSHESMCP